MLIVNIAGTEFEYLESNVRTGNTRGAVRNIRTIVCPADAIGQDALTALLTEENLESFTLTNTEGVAFYMMDDAGNYLADESGDLIVDHYEPLIEVCELYVMVEFAGLKSCCVQEATPDATAVYAPRIVIELGQRTYIEQQLHKLGL